MPRGPRASTVAAAFLVSLVTVSVGWPLGACLLRSGTGSPAGEAVDWPVDARLLVSSILIAALIGVIATVLAIPAAWLSRRLSLRWVVVLLAPMLLPSYLAYTGWSELRTGNTWFGRWLMTGPAEGANIRPLVAGWVCAVGGLALWSWPIATVVLAIRVRRLDDSVLDSLRLEPMSGPRRAVELARLISASLMASVVVVTLVMLGSAVPLHVAQLDTYAIALWRQLDLTPPGEHWRVWRAAWPLVAIAALSGYWIARGVLRPDTSGDEPRRNAGLRGAGGWNLGLAAFIWALSAAVPALVLAANIRDPRFPATFWRTRAEAVSVSAGIAAGVAALGALVAVAVWVGLSGTRRGAMCTRLAAIVLIAAGLAPGVLLGVAAAGAWNDLAFESTAAAVGSVVLTHAARLALVGVLVGAWAYRSQPADERRLMAIDGADTLRGWLGAAFMAQPGPILAAGLAMGLLSFHEIEAAVMLQPPGLDSFARDMLQLLHYSRYEDLSEAVVFVSGVGVLMGLLVVVSAGVMPGRARRTPAVRTEV